MKKGKEVGVKDIDKVYLRVANATGVSQRTVQRIATEGNISGLLSVFRTPGKKRSRSKPITDIDHFNQGVIKRCIHNFHKTEKEMPTINKLLAKLKRDINFRGAKTSLKTIVKNLGFKWRKTETNRMVPIEKTEIRLKRILYLKAMKKYRDEGRPIVFPDESYALSLSLITYKRKVKEVEVEYRKSDHIIDEMTEQLLIINTASDSESEFESENDDYDNEPMPSTSHGTQGADDFMSGISPLSDSD
ncbi:unnamed protein product [Arctia plantaginis]|uniref:Uncharacterized protein n=1 Tax=Arctia plantaginis TaxID=874455 RepID=A0A8S0ZZJ4_ARCPL|nr:unnamed protein product [Arctia plantaginis]